MKFNLSFVPPGGGEQDYMLRVDLPTIPSTGDLITVMREEGKGTEDFIVNRTWYQLKADKEGENTTVTGIWVECEFALSEFSSESHKECCKMYEGRTGILKQMPATMY